jgi:hypothetical protein
VLLWDDGSGIIGELSSWRTRMNIGVGPWECLGSLARRCHKVLEEVAVGPVYLNLYLLLAL